MIKTVKDLKDALEKMPENMLVEIYINGDESYYIDNVHLFKLSEEEFEMVSIFAGDMKPI